MFFWSVRNDVPQRSNHFFLSLASEVDRQSAQYQEQQILRQSEPKRENSPKSRMKNQSRSKFCMGNCIKNQFAAGWKLKSWVFPRGAMQLESHVRRRGDGYLERYAVKRSMIKDKKHSAAKTFSCVWTRSRSGGCPQHFNAPANLISRFWQPASLPRAGSLCASRPNVVTCSMSLLAIASAALIMLFDLTLCCLPMILVLLYILYTSLSELHFILVLLAARSDICANLHTNHSLPSLACSIKCTGAAAETLGGSSLASSQTDCCRISIAAIN